MEEEITTTYEIDTNEGRYRVTVPASYKVTFGPVAVGGKLRGGGYGEPGGSMALRIYESDTKQRAVFVGVRSFRDLSIPLMREHVQVEGSTEWVAAENLSTSNSKRVTKREWKKVED